ncbi:glucosamine-6-phosphate deaminase [Alternaria alternata]|nr:glucosamine-6-phosphate deaminase [Alternaria alternata]
MRWTVGGERGGTTRLSAPAEGLLPCAMLQEHGRRSMVILIGRDSSGNLIENGSRTSRHGQPATNITIASVIDKADVLMESQEDDVTFLTRGGGRRALHLWLQSGVF